MKDVRGLPWDEMGEELRKLLDSLDFVKHVRATLDSVGWEVWLGLGSLLALFLLLRWFLALLDRPRFEAQRRFLQELSRSRALREQEARRLWARWVRTRSRRLRGTIEWRVLDEETEKGRILLRPARPPRSLTALAGLDVHARRPQGGKRRAFIMTLPPHIRTVRQALSWVWRVPERKIRRGIEEH